MIRIVVDARRVGDRLSGIERYTTGLLRGLAEVLPEGQVAALATDPGALREHLGDHRIEIARCPPKRGRAAVRGVRALGGSLLHVPYLTAPLSEWSCPVVITVHDLIPVRYPQYVPHSKKARWHLLFRAWSRWQYRRAASIVTVSGHSRDDLVSIEGIGSHRIFVAHNGIDPAPPGTPADTIRKRLGARGALLTAIGRHEPYKNLPLLLRAFAALRADDVDATLVIGGARDPRYTPELENLRADLSLDRVVFTDYLSEADRAGLLAAADVFLFPSRCEGFGLPPLEAMAAGVPVVASAAPPMPEVLGSGARLVDPDDVSGWADAIRDLISDPAAAARQRSLGHDQVRPFTWRASAVAHLPAYARALGEPEGWPPESPDWLRETTPLGVSS